MNIELTVTNLTPANREAKFLKTAQALSKMLRLNAEIEAPTTVEKTFNPAETRDDNGKWTSNGNTANLPEIKGIKPIRVGAQNWRQVAQTEFDKIDQRIKSADGLVCPAADNKRVVGYAPYHLEYKNRNKKRLEPDIIRRVSLMPYVLPIIENGQRTNRQPKRESYEISAKVGNKKVSVVLVEKTGKKGLLYISVCNEKIKNLRKPEVDVGGSSTKNGVPRRQPSFSQEQQQASQQSHFVKKYLVTDVGGSPQTDARLVALTSADDQLLSLNHNIIIPQISAVSIEKASTHKYTSKKWVDDHWEYTYPQTNTERRANTASQITDVITGIQPLNVDKNNAQSIGRAYLAKIENFLKNNDVRCKWLQNRRVSGVDIEHLTKKHNKPRYPSDVIKHTKFLPYVLPIVQKYGHISEARQDKTGRYEYELLGKTELNGKKHAISVILREYAPGKGLELEHRSVFGFKNKLVKSLVPTDGQRQVLLGSPLSSPGSLTARLIADEAAHLEKAASPENRLMLIISDFSVSSIEKSQDSVKKSVYYAPANMPEKIILDIVSITKENRREKYVKAIREVSKALNIPLEIEAKRERYFYPVQQQLSDYWTGFYEPILKAVYKAVITAFGLPEVKAETVKKAIGDDITKYLKYKGKILYNPESGEPIKQKEFKALIAVIEKFLNSNTKDAAKRLILDSVIIEKLLKRMAKYQTIDAMQEQKLEALKYRGKTFDWIRQDFKNLESVLGRDLSREEKGKYQIITDWAAERVTRINDDTRNEIKNVLLDGVKNRRSRAQVSQSLFDKLGSLNRDWKRIAGTEMVNTANLAGILETVHNAPEGAKVYLKRYELANCCDKCKKWDGEIVLWSDTSLESDKIKDDVAKYAIWDGKQADSRANVLVPGGIHPNCRGGWNEWGGKQVDAIMAKLDKKGAAWDKAVTQTKSEFKKKGVDNPNDQTPGYCDRINELYRDAGYEPPVLKAFNANEARDEGGKWTAGGGREPWDSSTDKARELTAEKWGTPEEIAEMAKPIRKPPRHEKGDFGLKQYRKKLFETLKEIRSKGALSNKFNNQLKATLSGDSISKLVSDKAMGESFNKDAHWLAVCNVDKLFFNAIEPWKFDIDSDKNNQDLKDRHYLYAPLEYNNEIIPIKLTVKEFTDEERGTRLYSVEAIDEIIDIKKGRWSLGDGVLEKSSSLSAPARRPSSLQKNKAVLETAASLHKSREQPAISPPTSNITHLFDNINAQKKYVLLGKRINRKQVCG